MSAPWNEDDPRDLPRIESNLEKLLRAMVREAPRRVRPAINLAQSWHRAIFDGVHLPVAYYAGQVRDSDERFPALIGYEVTIGGRAGVWSELVPASLKQFQRSMVARTGRLDRILPANTAPRNRKELAATLDLAAFAHGEWVRIHPFANGNGRTARLWANWCAMRYDLPPFITIQPRPASVAYRDAAALSMSGAHAETSRIFKILLGDYLRRVPAEGSSQPGAQP